MSSVIITGWRKGFKKVSMTKLIRAYTGYDLARGKRCVDDVLGGETVALPGMTSEQAEHFMVEARELGAVCHVETKAVLAVRS